MKALTLFYASDACFSGTRADAPARAMRPPLFFSESWKPLPTPPDDHGAWPAISEAEWRIRISS